MNKLLVIPTAIALLAACSQEPQTLEPPKAAGNAEAGMLIAEAECSSCHGADGHGVAPGIPHLAGQPVAYLEKALADYEAGIRTHAALQDLTARLDDQQQLDLAAWYGSLPPTTVTDGHHLQLTSYEQGEQLAATCASCHGERGNSVMAGVPSLAGQQPLYFMAATQAYLHGTRDMSGMEDTVRGLSKTDIEKLALFYASQTPLPREAPTYGDPAAGQPLSASCGGCHGASGVSHDAATPSLAGQDPDYLVKATQDYRGHVRQHEVMFGEKTDADIRNIAAYYAVQAPRAAEDEPMSAEKLTRSCDRCHGPGVEVAGMAVPRLSGQDRDYLIMSLRAYRDDKRESTMMHKMSLPYSDSMIEAVATRYANRPPE